MPEQTDRLTDRLTDRRTDRKVKTEVPKIMFIASRLRLTLIIGGPIDTNTRIMYKKLQEKITKIAIFQQKKIFFEKFQKLYLDRNIGNKICSFQCCSDCDKPVRQYGRRTGIAKNVDTF